MIGGTFQEAGFLVALNETAGVEAWIVLLGAKLCNVPEDRRQIIRNDCIECLTAVGGLTLLNLPTMWEKLSKDNQ
jgi:hypothetical protein